MALIEDTDGAREEKIQKGGIRSRYVIKVDRRLADSKERAMPEEKTTADRLAAYSDVVFAVIVTIMVLGSGHWISRRSRLSGLCGPRPSAMR
jgi:hypothetical protein